MTNIYIDARVFLKKNHAQSNNSPKTSDGTALAQIGIVLQTDYEQGSGGKAGLLTENVAYVVEKEKIEKWVGLIKKARDSKDEKNIKIVLSGIEKEVVEELKSQFSSQELSDIFLESNVSGESITAEENFDAICNGDLEKNTDKKEVIIFTPNRSNPLLNNPDWIYARDMLDTSVKKNELEEFFERLVIEDGILKNDCISIIKRLFERNELFGGEYEKVAFFKIEANKQNLLNDIDKIKNYSAFKEKIVEIFFEEKKAEESEKHVNFLEFLKIKFPDLFDYIEKREPDYNELEKFKERAKEAVNLLFSKLDKKFSYFVAEKRKIVSAADEKFYSARNGCGVDWKTDLSQDKQGNTLAISAPNVNLKNAIFWRKDKKFYRLESNNIKKENEDFEKLAFIESVHQGGFEVIIALGTFGKDFLDYTEEKNYYNSDGDCYRIERKEPLKDKKENLIGLKISIRKNDEKPIEVEIYNLPIEDNDFAILSYNGCETVLDNLAKPKVVHCASGVGRTGAYILLEKLLIEAEKEPNVINCLNNIINNEKVSLGDLLTLYRFCRKQLRELRENRHSVQKVKQIEKMALDLVLLWGVKNGVANENNYNTFFEKIASKGLVEFLNKQDDFAFSKKKLSATEIQPKLFDVEFKDQKTIQANLNISDKDAKILHKILHGSSVNSMASDEMLEKIYDSILKNTSLSLQAKENFFAFMDRYRLTITGATLEKDSEARSKLVSEFAGNTKSRELISIKPDTVDRLADEFIKFFRSLETEKNDNRLHSSDEIKISDCVIVDSGNAGDDLINLWKEITFRDFSPEAFDFLVKRLNLYSNGLMVGEREKFNKIKKKIDYFIGVHNFFHRKISDINLYLENASSGSHILKLNELKEFLQTKREEFKEALAANAGLEVGSSGNESNVFKVEKFYHGICLEVDARLEVINIAMNNEDSDRANKEKVIFEIQELEKGTKQPCAWIEIDDFLNGYSNSIFENIAKNLKLKGIHNIYLVCSDPLKLNNNKLLFGKLLDAFMIKHGFNVAEVITPLDLRDPEQNPGWAYHKYIKERKDIPEVKVGRRKPSSEMLYRHCLSHTGFKEKFDLEFIVAKDTAQCDRIKRIYQTSNNAAPERITSFVVSDLIKNPINTVVDKSSSISTSLLAMMMNLKDPNFKLDFMSKNSSLASILVALQKDAVHKEISKSSVIEFVTLLLNYRNAPDRLSDVPKFDEEYLEGIKQVYNIYIVLLDNEIRELFEATKKNKGMFKSIDKKTSIIVESYKKQMLEFLKVLPQAYFKNTEEWFVTAFKEEKDKRTILNTHRDLSGFGKTATKKVLDKVMQIKKFTF